MSKKTCDISQQAGEVSECDRQLNRVASASEPSFYWSTNIRSQVNENDLEHITSAQLESTRLETAKRELLWYSGVVKEMKGDLELVFQRIRSLKQRFSQDYPNLLPGCEQRHDVPDDSE